MLTPLPAAERIYQKFVTASPALPSVGLVCFIERTSLAETSVSESCEYENKYYNICSELQNLVSIAKFSAPLVFAERNEYNNVALKIKYLYVHA